MPPAEIRTAWIASCVFWAWSWAVAAFTLTPLTFGLSLVMLIPAGLSVWAICIPIGRADHQPPRYMQPAPPPILPGNGPNPYTR